MKSFIPNKKQWKSWSMPSKVGYIGSVLGAISFVFALYVWIFPASPLNHNENLLDVSGSVFLDDTPLAGAKVTITGNSAEWPTGKNGSFAFKIQDNGTDSLGLAVLHAPEFETVLNNLAWHYAVRNEKFTEALSLSKRSLKLAPNEPSYLDTLGEILLRLRPVCGGKTG